MEITDCDEEIIVGTNEEFILGFTILASQDGGLTLEPSFSSHAHIGRVKQVAVCKQFLVTGSTDEFIKIFNLRSRKEVGSILSQEGTINCLQFHESGFLFSGSEDGTIGIFKMGKWRLVKELKGHSDAVTGVAVHPSGKLALSISKDKRVITWDLMKGKKAHTAGLKKKAGDYIMWSPDGSHYLVSAANILNIYSIAHGNIVHTIDFKENIYCFCYLTEKLLVVGGERKNLVLYDLESKTEVIEWEAHENRTKCLIMVNASSEKFRHFASASSDGLIKIWMINISDVTRAPKLLGQVNTNSRIICMAFKPGSNTVSAFSDGNQQSLVITNPKKKRKRKICEEQFSVPSKRKYQLSNNNNNMAGSSQNKQSNKNMIRKDHSEEDKTNLQNDIESFNEIVVNKTRSKTLFRKKKSNFKISPRNQNLNLSDNLKNVKNKVHFKRRVKKKVINSSN